MSKLNLAANAKLKICMFGQKRIPSREGGVEVVVEELATRMAQQGHWVTCYNRGGHHVSGSSFDEETLSEYKGVRLKTVPTIDKKGLAAVTNAAGIIQQCLCICVAQRPGGDAAQSVRSNELWELLSDQ